eukprot:2339270-Amphidinium_carterae.1
MSTKLIVVGVAFAVPGNPLFRKRRDVLVALFFVQHEIEVLARSGLMGKLLHRLPSPDGRIEVGCEAHRLSAWGIKQLSWASRVRKVVMWLAYTSRIRVPRFFGLQAYGLGIPT